MLTDALNLAYECFATPLAWFTQIWSACGALPLYLALFLIYTFVRLIFRAYVGDAISDGVQEYRSSVRNGRINRRLAREHKSD